MSDQRNLYNIYIFYTITVVKVIGIIVSGTSVNATASNSRLDEVMPIIRNQTRKRFRPTAHELSILQTDHQQDYRLTLGERSEQFGVSEKQILDWHKRYKPEWVWYVVILW